MSTCRSCDQEIEWARTASGKAIPLDPGPVPDGNLVVVSGVARARTADDDRLHREPRRSHFASCPFAAAHRRK